MPRRHRRIAGFLPQLLPGLLSRPCSKRVENQPISPIQSRRFPPLEDKRRFSTMFMQCYVCHGKGSMPILLTSHQDSHRSASPDKNSRPKLEGLRQKNLPSEIRESRKDAVAGDASEPLSTDSPHQPAGFTAISPRRAQYLPLSRF